MADALRASGFTLQERRREREAVQAEREVRDDVLLRAVSLELALSCLRTEEQRGGVADGENLARLLYVAGVLEFHQGGDRGENAGTGDPAHEARVVGGPRLVEHVIHESIGDQNELRGDDAPRAEAELQSLRVKWGSVSATRDLGKNWVALRMRSMFANANARRVTLPGCI